jgi:hypothetical protein
MPDVKNTYNRNKLYGEVWEKPLTQVAKQYNISDKALWKMCKSLRVPLPKHGHWIMRPEHRPKRPPLPQLRPGDREEVTTVRWVIDQGPPSPEYLEFLELLKSRPDLAYPAVKAPFEVELPNTTRNLHPLAARFEVDSWHGQTEETADRIRRITSCLYRGVERAGHRVEWGQFVVEGEPVPFKLTEIPARFPYKPAKGEVSTQKWTFRGSGRLRLLLGYRTWEDSQKGTIESRINAIFFEVFRYPSQMKVDRARQAEENKIRAAAVARRAEAQRLEDEKKRRAEAVAKAKQSEIDNLVKLAERWERSRLVTRFVDAVRSEAQRFGALEPDSRTAQWLAWAHEAAIRLDPIPKMFGDPPGPAAPPKT